MGDARHGINMPENISTVIIAQQLPGLCVAAAAGGSQRPPTSHTCKNMQIESIRHLKRNSFFFTHRLQRKKQLMVIVVAGLDLLLFETSFIRVLKNMLILGGIFTILRISVLLFTRSVFLMNELDVAYAYQLIAEMHCAKNIE